MKILDWLAKRRKAAVVVLGLACGVAVQAGLTSNHWVSLGVGIATVLGVYTVPNKPADG